MRVKFVLTCRKGKTFRGLKLSEPIVRILPIGLNDRLFKLNTVDLEGEERADDPKFKLNPKVKENLKEMLDTELMVEEEYYTRLAFTYIFRTAI